MPTGQMPTCHYPQGGIAKSAGGRGIFRDAAGEPIRIWVDYMLKSARSIIKAAQHEDEVDSDTSIASAYHYEPETQLLILHPSSHHIFDSYCHPDWLTPRSRKKYDKYREEHGDEEEEWTRKVLLKESWVWRCIAAGRFLGQSDDWGGCRVGGPPKGQVVDVQTDVDMITLNDGVKRKASVDDIDVDIDVNMELDELEEGIEEDIKPSLHLEPVDIPEARNIQIELHTPSQPFNDVRHDDILPMEEPKELDPSLEKKEPSPPPVRRSSRRSRSKTQLVQVKDELESSDEESLATNPQARKSTGNDDTSRPSSSHQGKISAAASLAEEEDFDISMLDSGPSSQFQSPPPRPAIVEGKIFSGLVFWVDLSMKNRGDLLKEIKTAGGKIAADHEDATHVLIYKFAQQALRWKEIVAELAPKGIWFLSPDWAKKSVAEKKRLPEIDHCVPGGTLAGSTSALKAVEEGIPQQMADALIESDKPTKLLDKSFKALKASGLTEQEIAENMHSRGGAISVKKCKVLYEAWIERTGRFSQLPPLSEPNASAFAPLQETTLQVKTEHRSTGPLFRLSKLQLEAIFAKETWRLQKICSGHVGEFTKFLAGKYKVYTPGSWGNYFSEWYSGKARWAAASRTFQGVSLSIGELREGSIANIATPGRDAIELPDDSTNLSMSEMASALHSYFKHSGNNVVINASLGEHMEALHPAYTAWAWEKMAREWKEGIKKFADFGPRWNGEHTASVEAVDQLDGLAIQSARSASGSKQYTEDEELSMGLFVLHQESEGKVVTSGSWSIFAEVYPYRTKAAWAEHYRVYKDRIMDIARRQAPTEEANMPEPEGPDPSYSDRSPSPVASGSQPKPQRQKVAVSKKDYEDLARFIVDNIAEGDVPDSKDFAAFSKDHPERSGSSWYTIWHRDKYRSTLLPLIDELRRAATPRSQSSQIRAARAGSRPHPNAYTDEEERQMAEFIVRHVPPDRPPKVADWNKFQRSHTKRTAPSWMEHYRVYKPRIDGLVAEIKATNPSLARHPSGTAQDAIELGSEEEEEEEVEEIVPIRPPRSRSRRSDVIIIED